MISIILSGRNDDYGKGFRERLFRATEHNAYRLVRLGVPFEFVLAEWNPLPGAAPLAEEFVQRVPNARAVIIPPEIHRRYSLNPSMPFHEMAAKNAALRRARGEHVLVANADILLGDDVLRSIAEGGFRPDTLYRAHRIDVLPELSWEQMQDPANHLLSGEGRIAPCYYMGAGGDFCLAARDLWRRLRGFNETIRFTTRAKDWQFYLSAAARGIGVYYLGNVFHLDHDCGFRNTPAKDRDTDAAHFGGIWNFEFGLPVGNSEDWGFGGVKENVWRGDERITVLDPQTYHVSEETNRRDLQMRDWLTFPRGCADTKTAILYHAICAAGREGKSLILRLQDMRTRVAFSCMEPIARESSVPLFCEWSWEEIPGFAARSFRPEPASPRSNAWVLEERCGRMVVEEFSTGLSVNVLPRRIPPAEPEFNPVMVHRLLRAVLRLQRSGTRRIGIYGAGTHTAKLLDWGIPDDLKVAAIVETIPRSDSFRGLPVVPLSKLRLLDVDAVLISSSTFEPEMIQLALQSGAPRIVPMYEDWPPDLWESGTEPASDALVRSA